MPTIKVKWSVEELANVLTLFDVQKVYRSTTGKTGPYTELTNVLTRVALVAGQVDYYHDDTAGLATYWYRISYFHSVTLLESELSDPISGAGGGNYITVQDVRDEGVTETVATDARIMRAIRLAEEYIEHATGRWFYPRALTLRVDGAGGRALQLDVPIIQLDSIQLLYEWVEGEPLDTLDVGLDSVRIYNRHLTMGLRMEDDREDPKVVFEAYDPDGFAYWPVGKQNVILQGWFGYTVLAPDDPVGETEAGSQKPLAMGRAPQSIVDCALRLAIRNLPLRYDVASVQQMERAGQVTKMKTRDQEINWSDPNTTPGGTSGLTGDAAIDAIIRQYRRGPMAGMV